MIKKLLISISLLWSCGANPSTTYSPHDCEYSVTFPAKPEYATVVDPNFGKRMTAKYGNFNKAKGYYLEADCTGGLEPDNTKQLNEGALKKIIISNTNRIGVKNAKYSYNKNKLGNSAHSIGTLEINNIKTIFQSFIYVGKTSFIMLYTGTSPDGVQYPEVTDYLKSLKYEEFLTLE